MRCRAFAWTIAVSLLAAPGARGQSCTGLCLQQVSCPSGQTTSLSGTVYAPNGTDPLPNVTVYIPNAAVSAFTPGVSCPVIGQPPSGSPLVGTTTAADGTFTLTNVPVGTNLPLVIQAGRWRRQLVVPGTTSCSSTSLQAGFARMPRNQTEGDIPKIAVDTGAADSVECVLRKLGISDTEFTNPGGAGRINLYTASGAAGARIDTSTPAEPALMGNLANLDSYDVLMLPCEGNAFTKSATELSNLISFADAGGRVYSSHYGYEWMYQNPPFSSVASWNHQNPQLASGTATVNTSFPDGATLAQWLQIVGASTTLGQIPINTIRFDQTGVVAPTQSWLTLNDSPYTGAVMQFTFDTPVGTTPNKCGRVLFNEYHVENSSAQTSQGKSFPAECTLGTITPQEKLLEYSLFDLTNEGSGPTLTPTAADFGSEPLGFTTPSQTFTWKNNSVFPVSVASVAASGDFLITANTCSATASILSGGTCTIAVAFKPAALGPRTGDLSVVSNSSTLTSSLTGIGTADLALSATSLDFGNVDVSATASRTLTLTNNTPASLALQPLAVSGDFGVTSNCGSALAATSSCTLTVTFTPSATGPRSGTLAVTPANAAYLGGSVALSGNGVDFALALNPTSGSVIAGFGTTSTLAVTPIAGFSAPVQLSCSSAAPASTCTLAASTVTPSSNTAVTVTLATVSQFAVIGFGGMGLTGATSLLALGSGTLLWTLRRRAAVLRQAGLNVHTCLLLAGLSLLSCFGLGTIGCSGNSPARNAQYTPAGVYAVTITATDGTLKHTGVYTLDVTTK